MTGIWKRLRMIQFVLIWALSSAAYAENKCVNALKDPTPQSIYLSAVEKVEGLLKAAQRPKTFRDIKISNELRSAVFKLEGWARIHKAWPHKKEQKVLEKIWEKAKALEDVFGQVDLMKALEVEAMQKGNSDLAKHFNDKAEQKFQEAKSLLKEEDWLVQGDGKSRTDKISEKLEKEIDWPSAEKQYDFVAKEFARSIKEFSETYQKDLRPKLFEKTYDYEIMEYVVHEFRRKVRWYAIYIQTGESLFALAPLPKSPTAAEAKLIEAYKDSPFTKLPVQKSTKGLIDPISYYEITRLIKVIGELKDSGEKYFLLREALIEIGYSDAKATALVKEWYGDVPKELPPKIQELMKEYESFQPLEVIRQNLKDSREQAEP